jgi:hypothetical protein
MGITAASSMRKKRIYSQAVANEQAHEKVNRLDAADHKAPSMAVGLANHATQLNRSTNQRSSKRFEVTELDGSRTTATRFAAPGQTLLLCAGDDLGISQRQ